MRKPVCKYCGEYTKCVCTYSTCAKCGETYSNFDSDINHQMYEYRGFILCQKCHKKGIEEVNYKRAEVSEVVEASTKSQVLGEWMNGGHKNIRIDAWGKPIPSRIKEPQILKDYENGIL